MILHRWNWYILFLQSTQVWSPFQWSVSFLVSCHIRAEVLWICLRFISLHVFLSCTAMCGCTWSVKQFRVAITDSNTRPKGPNMQLSKLVEQHLIWILDEQFDVCFCGAVVDSAPWSRVRWVCAALTLPLASAVVPVLRDTPGPRSRASASPTPPPTNRSAPVNKSNQKKKEL